MERLSWQRQRARGTARLAKPAILRSFCCRDPSDTVAKLTEKFDDLRTRNVTNRTRDGKKSRLPLKIRPLQEGTSVKQIPGHISSDSAGVNVFALISMDTFLFVSFSKWRNNCTRRNLSNHNLSRSSIGGTGRQFHKANTIRAHRKPLVRKDTHDWNECVRFDRDISPQSMVGPISPFKSDESREVCTKEKIQLMRLARLLYGSQNTLRSNAKLRSKSHEQAPSTKNQSRSTSAYTPRKYQN